MSLYTGKRMYRFQWTEIPIYYDVVASVRDLDEGEDAKKMTDNYSMFYLAPGVLITDGVNGEDIPIREKTEVNNNKPGG